MSEGMRLEQKMVTGLLLAVVLGGSVAGNAYRYADEMAAGAFNEVRGGGEDGATYRQAAQSFLSELPFKRNLVELNGMFAKNLGLRELYRESGIVLKNGFVAGIYAPTTTDYEIGQMAELKAFLDARGIPLLYVNEPTKYFEDDVVEEELGRRTCINENTDLFLERLDGLGVHYLDLRDHYAQMGADSFDLFYRTDHHWTVPAGKIAAEAIVAELNAQYGYDIDLSLYDDSRFSVTHYEDAWLGEQGKKLGASFVGLDDYDLVLPGYETNFTVTYQKGDVLNGSFSETVVNHGVYLPEKNLDVYAAPSWHYSYLAGGLSGSVIVNHQNPGGKKVLVLGDSYEQVTVPYLALGVSEVRTLVLRSYDGSLREYIDSHEIDTVVVAYASFMIGAHDYESSANYAMFDFR